MELAGVIGMGPPQEGIRPDLLKYVLVKGQETSEQQTGKATFWVFNQSHSVVVPSTAPAEPHEQHIAAVPHDTAPEAPAVKQRPITDCFSPRPSTSEASASAQHPSATHPFITPYPSVKLAEVPTVFQVQSDAVVEDYLDPTHPLFEREVLKPSREPPSTETKPSSHGNHLNTPSLKESDAATKKAIDLKKRFRTYSSPSFAATWYDGTVSGSSNSETMLESPAQGSQSCFPPWSILSKVEVPSDCRSSPPLATDFIEAYSDAEAETGDTENVTDKYWIKKDEDRLAVIANMEKQTNEMKGELTGAITAFQIASDANQKLQAELEKKNTSLTQIEEEVDSLCHNLDAAEMNNEKLEKELDNTRTDWKYQYDRAEEALTMIHAEPSRRVMANLLQAKTKAESDKITQQKEMESEIRSLESQVKHRTHSVAQLTETLSRVADSDRWKDIKKELEELRIRAGDLPKRLHAAELESEKWKKEYGTMLQEYEICQADKASLEENLESVKDQDLDAMRQLRGDLQDQAAKSERSLRKCLRKVFERMVRCSLCLETAGYLPFDMKHQAIYEKVSELTGRDYQNPLMEYYADNEIQGEFHFGGDGDENAEGSDGVHVLNNGGPAGNKIRENDQEHTQDSSSTPAPGTIQNENVFNSTANEEQVQESPETQHSGSEFLKEIFSMTGFSNTAGSNGPNGETTFDFGFGHNSPPLFAKLAANSKAKSGEPSMPPKPLKTSTSMEGTTSSNAGKGHGQNTWNGTSSANGDNNPFSSEATGAENHEAKSKSKSPNFNSSSGSQPAEAKTPAFQNPEKEAQDGETLKARTESTHAATEATRSPPHLQGSEFGGPSNPFTSTGSSAPFPAHATPSASTGMFQFGRQNLPSMTVEPEKQTVEEGTARAEETPKEEVSNVGAPKDKVPEEEEEEMPFGHETPENDAPANETSQEETQQKQAETTEKNRAQTSRPSKKSAPADPSPLRRSEKRAAKKAAEKAIKRAEMEKKSAKALASQRVQRAMLMR